MIGPTARCGIEFEYTTETTAALTGGETFTKAADQVLQGHRPDPGCLARRRRWTLEAAASPSTTGPHLHGEGLGRRRLRPAATT
jgi:hypothetical protein